MTACGRKLGKAAGICVIAVLLLAVAGVSHAANPYMAELDILEYQASKIEPAPDIALASTDGRTVNLRDLKGRSLLLVFWAST